MVPSIPNIVCFLQLTIPDLYEFNSGSEAKPDLGDISKKLLSIIVDNMAKLIAGIGRYSKCFKAVNKGTRKRVFGDEDCGMDDAIDDSGCTDHEHVNDDDTVGQKTEISSIKKAWKGAIRKIRKKKRKKKKKKDNDSSTHENYRSDDEKNNTARADAQSSGNERSDYTKSSGNWPLTCF